MNVDVSHAVNLDLDGRRALVTGAASGIGAACAARLAAAGAHVIAADRNFEAVSELAESIGADAVQVDLSDPDFDVTVASDVDLLVNNAGIQHVSPIESFPLDQFRAIIAIMLEAPFRLIRAALPHMYGQGFGRIINISSVHGLRASPNKSAYVAAKHGLEGLSKVTALEGGPRGVTSNTICPAYVRTALVENQIADQARVHGIAPERVISEIMLTEPAIKRLVEPSEVAELMAFLCLPEAGFASGTSWILDGGWTAR
jgi:3-hydroxybutyrate dehydrogenase